MKNLAQTAPLVAPDHYPDEAPEATLEYGYEPTPTEADQRWWADQQDTRAAREAAEDAIDRADRERYELDELDRLLRERRYDVSERRGFGPGHMAEGDAW